jgi:hypothetical protein
MIFMAGFWSIPWPSFFPGKTFFLTIVTGPAFSGKGHKKRAARFFTARRPKSKAWMAK